MKAGWLSAAGVCVVGIGTVVDGVDAQTVTVDLIPTRSNTLFEDPLGQTSGGAAPWIFAGLTLQPQLRRGLLAFDVTAIPAGSTVTAVALTLHLSRTSTGNEPATLHTMLADWGSAGSLPPEPGGFGAPAEAGDATWLYSFYDGHGGGQEWGTPGGDFDADALATTVVGGVGFYTWSSGAMAADVQRWLDEGPGGNFGWMLRGNEDVPQSAKRYDTQWHEDPRFWPRLTVTYTIPGPGAAGIVAGGALLWGRRRRS